MATRAVHLPGQIHDESEHNSSSGGSDLAQTAAATSASKLTSPRTAFRLIPELKPLEVHQVKHLPHSSPPPLPAETITEAPSPKGKPRLPKMEHLVVAGDLSGRISEEESTPSPRPDSSITTSTPSVLAQVAEDTALTETVFEEEKEENIADLSPQATTTPYRRQSMMRIGSQSRPGGRIVTKLSREENTSVSAAIAENDTASFNSDTHSENTEDLTFTLPELTKEGEETGRTVRETWPTVHVMLLYMLSRYAVCARTAQDKETWIRQIPLLVLMYEGIAAGALNFDYAPASILIAQEGRPKRIWMNTTQDGKSAIDDLRESSLINGLKLSTKDYHSVTAFQVSLRGLQLLAQVGKDIRAKVDAFIFAPKPYRHELLKIRYIPIKDEVDPEQIFTNDPPSGPSWTFNRSDKNLMGKPTNDADKQAEDTSEFNEEGRFILESIGYFRYSEVTETEDVSYVSSPFVPQCVRGVDAYQQLSSNAHRAHEAASGQSNIRDTLSEAIVLANPVCLIGEWIPFGSNQIVALNERFGSMDRCQGGLFTSLIDDRPTDTQFEVPPGLTEVRILDYDPVRYINFEAEINFPEDDGIVQVEHFGIHLNVDGTIFYGIKVDTILDKRSDRISVDLLSRLLVDIHQDSSEIMDDLLSSYQSNLLDMVFLGDIANRGKFNMIMADQIDPFMPGLEYMDRGDYENELKQVLGDIHCAYDIGDDSVLIVGRDGMLIAGSASKRFEKVFIAYFSLLCREMFLRSFFKRIFVLEELLKHIRQLIFRAKEDPNHLVTIRGKLNQATNDLILFTDTLGYLLESLEFVKIPHKSAHAGEEEEAIFSYLNLKKQHHDILLRARDLEKLVHGAKYEVVNLRQMAEVLNTSQLEDIFKTVESNTKVLADASVVTKKSNASFDLVQLLLAGSFAFTLLDRIPGGSLNVGVPKWVETSFFKTIINVPFLFFVLNMLWMAVCIFVLMKFKQKQHKTTTFGKRTLRIKVNKAINVENFEIFLSKRLLVNQESVSQLASELRRVMWRDVSGERCKDEENHTSNRAARSTRIEPVSWKYRFKQYILTSWKKWSAAVVKWITTAGNSVAPGPNDGSTVNVNMPVLDAGIPVDIEVEYDSRHGFLLFVTFRFRYDSDSHKKSKKRDKQKWRSLLSKWLGLLTRSKTATRRLSSNATAKSFHLLEQTQPTDSDHIEKELMAWFAGELKEHNVVKNIDQFLGAV